MKNRDRFGQFKKGYTGGFQKGNIPWTTGQRNGIDKICPICRKIFYIFPYRVNAAKYCSRSCAYKCSKRSKNISKGLLGSKNKRWKGGKQIWKGRFDTKYILVKNYTHPYRRKRNVIFEHRLIVEKQIGRYLKPKEKVHHRNRNGLDNRPKNLMAFTTHGIHLRFERKCLIKKEDIVFDGRTYGKIDSKK